MKKYNYWKLCFGWTLFMVGVLIAAWVKPTFFGVPFGTLLAFFGGEINGDELKK